jgi:outer membrane receptor protein involved in Fe transport
VTRFFDEFRDDKWWQTSLNFNGDLGFASFVSTTSYFDRTSSYEWDNQVYNQWQTSYYGIYNGFLPYDFEYEFGTNFNFQTQKRFAQELRLTSQSESKLQWMVGAFYDEVKDQWNYGAKIDALTQTTAWDAINNGWDVEYTYNGYTYTYHYNGACDYAAQGYDVACPLPATNITYVNDYDRKIKQLAFFGELTYNLTDQWTVTGGMRWFQFDRKDLQIYQVPQGQPPLGSFGYGEGIYASEGKDSDVVWKFSTQYNFTDETMVYFLFSEGFRLGGNNSPRAAATGTIPATYDPDLLKNYELGTKTQWLDNRLLINVSLFNMQWSDIQINSRVGDGPWWLRGTWNGETGESIGAEMNFEWQATQNLSFEGSAYFADSKYTADSYDPRGNLYLQDGEDMPNAPKVKYWLAAEYTVPGIAGLNGDLWFRYDTTYQGKTWDNIDAAIEDDPEGRIPGWHSSNLQIGLDMQNNWSMALMVRNIWNNHGINSLYNSTYASDWFGDPRWRNERTLQRPRTIGLTFRKTF